MRVDLLGTGSADRWPNPWCACSRCEHARRTGAHRNRTSALVDGQLLIDPGPDLGARGVDLTGVGTVLISHDHPDHLDPAFLLAWSWAALPGGGLDRPSRTGPRPLRVAGPGEAVARCRPWVGPDAPVEFVELRAGDELDAGDLRVRALPAAHSTRGGADHDGTALLYEVTGSARLLYATDTAALPHDRLAERYDLVLLELTFGDVTDHGTAHLDLPRFGHEVSLLRAAGRLPAASRVIAVHLSHHNPTDLAGLLAGVGAEVVDDGTTVELGAARPAPGRRLLVTGGARSGKSQHAESLLAGRASVTYVATAPGRPEDPEWVERIAAHRRRRPPGWQVRETADLVDVLEQAAPGDAVLIDCLTLWLAGTVDRADGWDRPARARAAVEQAREALTGALRRSVADVVLVTNEVGSGIVPGTASGRLFRDLLGAVNAAIATACDDVVLVSCGIPQTLKGRTWKT